MFQETVPRRTHTQFLRQQNDSYSPSSSELQPRIRNRVWKYFEQNFKSIRAVTLAFFYVYHLEEEELLLLKLDYFST